MKPKNEVLGGKSYEGVQAEALLDIRDTLVEMLEVMKRDAGPTWPHMDEDKR